MRTPPSADATFFSQDRNANSRWAAEFAHQRLRLEPVARKHGDFIQPHVTVPLCLQQEERRLAAGWQFQLGIDAAPSRVSGELQDRLPRLLGTRAHECQQGRNQLSFAPYPTAHSQFLASRVGQRTGHPSARAADDRKSERSGTDFEDLRVASGRGLA